MVARSRLRNGASRLWRGDQGAALVEFAFSAIVFFMVVFGTINFGLAVWRYNLVSNLAQEGARWASVRGSTAPTPATAGTVQTFVQGRSMGLNPTVAATWPGGNAAGQSVTVTVTTIFQPLTGLVPQAAITLQNSATMVIAR